MKILDVCCGSRMFWYDKKEPHTTYMDIRKAVYTAMDRGNERKIEIDPDIQSDWKHMYTLIDYQIAFNYFNDLTYNAANQLREEMENE